MSNIKRKKGFTLVELLIAVAVFAIFLTSVMTLVVDMYRSARRITLEEQLYQDLRAMLKQITIMVENNAIDYEEYYRAAGDSDDYADSYGNYAKLFYDWGSDDTPGVLCNDGIEYNPSNPCEVIDKTTLDTNVGRNPALATVGDPDQANAFCSDLDSAIRPCPPDSYQNELYLINARGNKKTFLALEPITKTDYPGIQENVLSILQMDGSDTTGNDITDTWNFSATFHIDGNPADDLRSTKDETAVFDNFVPISPLRTNITNLQFYVSPYEDPYKAFAEVEELVQPHVTIVITVEPSVSELRNYLGPVPQKTLQTTVYSRVRKDVKSY